MHWEVMLGSLREEKSVCIRESGEGKGERGREGFSGSRRKAGHTNTYV